MEYQVIIHLTEISSLLSIIAIALILNTVVNIIAVIFFASYLTETKHYIDTVINHLNKQDQP